MRWKKARIAVVDRFGNILLTRMYNNPCCTTHAELMAIKAGYKIIGGVGTIYNDNTGAILKFKELLSRKKALLVNVRYNWLGKSAVDRASKIRNRHKKYKGYKVNWSKYHLTRKAIIKEWKRIEKEKQIKVQPQPKPRITKLTYHYFCSDCANPLTHFDIERRRCNFCLRPITRTELLFR